MIQTKATVLILENFLISRKNHKARVKFAKMHLHWNVEEWKKILFPDESKFNLKGADFKHNDLRIRIAKTQLSMVVEM